MTCPQALAIRLWTSGSVCAQACVSRNPTGMDSHGCPPVERSSVRHLGHRAWYWFIPLLGGTPGRGRATVLIHSPAAGYLSWFPVLTVMMRCPACSFQHFWWTGFALSRVNARGTAASHTERACVVSGKPPAPHPPWGRSAHHELGAGCLRWALLVMLISAPRVGGGRVGFFLWYLHVT